jgi:hypothetical protein
MAHKRDNLARTLDDFMPIMGENAVTMLQMDE